MSESHTLLDKADHVATVTLNRPEARNALSSRMLSELADAWSEVDGDDGIRVAVLTGAGGTFCSGADLKAFTGDAGDNTLPDPEKALRGLLRHHRLTKPLIAAVEGYAVAGGMEIMLAADLRVIAENAVLGLTEVRRGLFPLGGSTVRLPRQIGHARAMEVLLTGEHLSARTAEHMGLVNRVVADGQALAEARDLAERIAANSPVAVQAVKRSVQQVQGLSEEDGLAKELEIGMPVFFSDDAREGTLAFKEKRPARFTGQ